MRKLIGTLLAPLVAYGWWDAGHAICGAIAEAELTTEEKLKLQELIKMDFSDDKDYDVLNEFVLIPIWADHIKCYNGESTPCKAFEMFDGLKLFDNMHWTSHINYWEDGIEDKLKDTVYKHYPLPDRGAEWTMQKFVDSLTNNFNANTSYQGTRLSVSLQLRLLTHLFTDVHNPAHTSEVFSSAHVDDKGPIGDMGANRWLLDMKEDTCKHIFDLQSSATTINNLHALWDALIGSRPERYPDVTVEKAREWANELTSKYPKEHEDIKDRITGDLDGTNIVDMVRDSNNQAKDKLFKEFDWTISDNTTCDTQNEGSEDTIMCPVEGRLYCPGKAYMEDMKKFSEKQVVIGGYRMATMLKKIIPHLPTEAEILNDLRPSKAALTAPLIVLALLAMVH